MAEEGASIGSLRELRDRLPCAVPPLFDQRPGELEATRGLDAAPVQVVAKHEADGWKVALLAGAVAHSLTADQARRLAIELADHAALIEHGWIP